MARICQCPLVLWNGNGPHSCIINGLSLVLTCHWMVQNQSFKLQRLRWPFSKHAACWGIASPFRNWTDRAFLQSRALGLRTCRYQHQEVLINGKNNSATARCHADALAACCMGLCSLSYESVLSLDEWKRSSQNSYGYELEAQWQRKHVIWSMLIPREVQIINPKKKENNHEARTYGFGSHLEAILGSSWGIWDVFGGHFERLGANLSQQEGY